MKQPSKTLLDLEARSLPERETAIKNSLAAGG